MTSDRKSKGFTLLELIVTITVAGIILSFGVPSFIDMIQSNRTTTDTNDLVTALNLARSEATRRATGIRVCSSTDGTACNGTNDWSTGWIVIDGGGTVLRTWPERSDANVVTGDVSQVQFLARGSLSGGVPTLQVRQPDCTGTQVRSVGINAAGRISVTRMECS